MLFWTFQVLEQTDYGPKQTRYYPGGAENRRFCVFLTLEIEFLTTYEVSW